ncbi:Site-specific recombinase XerD [Lachnospiraceae bacterium]|nr:Site-specific recombinase XerD [Lachnospiraceae bacterium]
MERIRIRDLECYKNASDVDKNNKLISPDRCFDLTKLPNTDIRKEMEAYILNRGKTLKLISIRTELYPFNLFARFLSEQFPSLKSFLDVEESEIIRQAKVWLGKNGRKLSELTNRATRNKPQVKDAELVRYIKSIYRFYIKLEDSFNYDSDVWFLKGFPSKLIINPTKTVKSISFKGIKQSKIKDEIKRIIYIHLGQLAVGTVLAEMTAINRFVDYLYERHPEVGSLLELNRDTIEDYLLYLSIEDGRRKSYRTEVSHLKSVFILAGNLFESMHLKRLIINTDYQSEPRKLPRAYSKTEIKTLNRGMKTLDIQMQRLLVLHQMLGTGIGDTLTLKQNCLRYDLQNKTWVIRIERVKTKKVYEKSINDDVAKLIKSACEYTNNLYKGSEYVFVRESDSNQPMQYARVYDQMKTMIITNDLRDDNGELFKAGTHIFRSTYGCTLAELGATDEMIAALLGHSNTHSVRHYRKLNNKIIAEATRPYIKSKDEILSKIIDKWGDYNEAIRKDARGKKG